MIVHLRAIREDDFSLFLLLFVMKWFYALYIDVFSYVCFFFESLL
jgi:hypothetical protein